MRLPVNYSLPLAALILLGGYTVQVNARSDSNPVAPVTGPAADYPMVIGEPFTIGTITYTPVDQLNYDAVGHASVGDASLVGVTGAHKTLPLPSYIEVTALDSGKTILVRLERRGPMNNETLLELSPAAATQLGLVPGSRAPIRMRRVNPPEQERSALRQDRTVTPRMETPEALLKVLRRKLAEQSPLTPPSATPPPMPTSTPVTAPKAGTVPDKAKSLPGKPPVSQPAKSPEPVATATLAAIAKPNPAPTAGPPTKPAPSPTTAPATPASAPKSKGEAAPKAGSYIVQVAALSAKDRADKLAKQLGGQVRKPGKLWLVFIGPFGDRGEAGPALEKAKAAGYSDARIQRAD